MKEKSEYRY